MHRIANVGFARVPWPTFFAATAFAVLMGTASPVFAHSQAFSRPAICPSASCQIARAEMPEFNDDDPFTDDPSSVDDISGSGGSSSPGDQLADQVLGTWTSFLNPSAATKDTTDDSSDDDD